MTPIKGPAPTGQRRGKPWAIGGALALAAIATVGAAWWYFKAGRRCALCDRRGDARADKARGTINPALTVIVGSYVSGVIQDVYCDYNMQVKKGWWSAASGS